MNTRNIFAIFFTWFIYFEIYKDTDCVLKSLQVPIYSQKYWNCFTFAKRTNYISTCTMYIWYIVAIIFSCLIFTLLRCSTCVHVHVTVFTCMVCSLWFSFVIYCLLSCSLTSFSGLFVLYPHSLIFVCYGFFVLGLVA